MRVVDLDGLDGLVRTPAGSAAVVAVAGTAMLGLRARADSASGLVALAHASQPDDLPVEAALVSWTELQPLALVSGVTDEQVGDTVLGRATRPRVAARPTVPTPVSDAARPHRPVRRIVLSSLVALGALAALGLVGLRAGDSSLRAGELTRLAATPAPVSPSRISLDLPRAIDVPSAPLPGAAAEYMAPRRPVAMPPSAVTRRRLEWRLPARFAMGVATPADTQSAALPALVAELSERCLPGSIVVVGHTCRLGDEHLNFALARKRAQNARQLLVDNGLPAQHVRILSAAGRRPEASNTTAIGRERNRRVTVACHPQPYVARGNQ